MSEKCLRGPKLAIATMALGAAVFLEVLDITIANVSIPTIAGELSVSPREGTFVIAAYSLFAAICLPLAGWLAGRFGTFKLFVYSLVAFMVMSFLCGLAPNFEALVALRGLQGFVSAPMIPLAQAFFFRIYPREQLGLGIAIFMMVTTSAPIFGPLFGGYITEFWGWHWIFWINLPIGLACLLAILMLLPDFETPIKKGPVDTVGLVLLVLGVGALQLILDKGNDFNWFESDVIVILATIATLALSYLILWEWDHPHPIIDLGLFKNNVFRICVLLIFLGYGTFLGGAVVFPLWLQAYLGYTASWAGLVTAPMGVLPFCLAPLIGFLVGRAPTIFFTITSIVLAIFTFYLNMHLTSTVTPQLVMTLRLLQGLSLAFFFSPLMQTMMSSVSKDQMASATSMSTFLRTLGGAFGVAGATTLVEHYSLISYAEMVQYVTEAKLQGMGLMGPHLSSNLAIIDRLISVEANTVAMGTWWGYSILIYGILLIMACFLGKAGSTIKSIKDISPPE